MLSRKKIKDMESRGIKFSKINKLSIIFAIIALVLRIIGLNISSNILLLISVICSIFGIDFKLKKCKKLL